VGDPGPDDDAPAATSGPRRPCVLYIEDDAANVRLVEHILGEIHDLRIVSAATGEHGLRLARELDLSLILLDLHLPDIDGEQVLHRLRASPHARAVPVVVLSGDLPGARRARLAELGSVAFLDKPYALADMITIVKTLVAPSRTSRR
jgi:CheY-like chemotaxis protein